MWIFYFDSLAGTWESHVDMICFFIGVLSIGLQVYVRQSEGRKPFSREIYFWMLLVAPTWVILGVVDAIRPALESNMYLAPLGILCLVLPMWFTSIVMGRFLTTHLYMVLYAIAKVMGLVGETTFMENKTV